MYQFLMFIILLNTLLFMQMNHPLSMGTILLIQTILTTLFCGLMSKSFWFSYILFLIFIGGMLILFIYMASIASNEQVNFSQTNYIMFTYTLLNFIIIMLIYDYMLNLFNFNKTILMNNNENIFLMNNSLYLSNIFNYSNNYIIIMLAMYMLLTLIAVVKITDLFSGPLRPKFYE